MPQKWKHQTCNTMPAGEPDTVVFFDDEMEGQDTIYQRFPCGNLYPARSVTRSDAQHHTSVIAAWSKGRAVDDRRSLPALA